MIYNNYEISNGSTLTIFLLPFFPDIIRINLDIAITLSSLPLNQPLLYGFANRIEYLTYIVVILC